MTAPCIPTTPLSVVEHPPQHILRGQFPLPCLLLHHPTLQTLRTTALRSRSRAFRSLVSQGHRYGSLRREAVARMEVDYYRPAQLTQSIVLSRLAAGAFPAPPFRVLTPKLTMLPCRTDAATFYRGSLHFQHFLTRPHLGPLGLPLYRADHRVYPARDVGGTWIDSSRAHRGSREC